MRCGHSLPEWAGDWILVLATAEVVKKKATDPRQRFSSIIKENTRVFV